MKLTRQMYFMSALCHCNLFKCIVLKRIAYIQLWYFSWFIMFAQTNMIFWKHYIWSCGLHILFGCSTGCCTFLCMLEITRNHFHAIIFRSELSTRRKKVFTLEPSLSGMDAINNIISRKPFHVRFALWIINHLQPQRICNVLGLNDMQQIHELVSYIVNDKQYVSQ